MIYFVKLSVNGILCYMKVEWLSKKQEISSSILVDTVVQRAWCDDESLCSDVHISSLYRWYHETASVLGWLLERQ